MIRPHILDTLAQKQDCYISDLRLNPVNNQAALADLILLDNSVCPLNEWREKGDYLIGEDMSLEDIEMIKNNLLRKWRNLIYGKTSI